MLPLLQQELMLSEHFSIMSLIDQQLTLYFSRRLSRLEGQYLVCVSASPLFTLL